MLRTSLLSSLGIPKPKEKAVNWIKFGCYRPFTYPFLIRNYIKLLDLLGIDYTYFDPEYCCGLPLVMESTENSLGKATALSEEFNRKNAELARQKGVETLAYCCIGCVYAAKYSMNESSERHIYILDLIFDSMEKRANRITPTVMGYFEDAILFTALVSPVFLLIGNVIGGYLAR